MEINTIKSYYYIYNSHVLYFNTVHVKLMY